MQQRHCNSLKAWRTPGLGKGTPTDLTADSSRSSNYYRHRTFTFLSRWLQQCSRRLLLQKNKPGLLSWSELLPGSTSGGANFGSLRAHLRFTNVIRATLIEFSGSTSVYYPRPKQDRTQLEFNIRPKGRATKKKKPPWSAHWILCNPTNNSEPNYLRWVQVCKSIILRKYESV